MISDPEDQAGLLVFEPTARETARLLPVMPALPNLSITHGKTWCPQEHTGCVHTHRLRAHTHKHSDSNGKRMQKDAKGKRYSALKTRKATCHNTKTWIFDLQWPCIMVVHA